MAIANRCFLCQEREETKDHILLHCSETRVLWDLLFSFWGALGDTLSLGHPFKLECFFHCKEAEKRVESGSIVYFLGEKAMNDIVLRDEVFSLQKVKFFFVHLLWSETKLFFVDGPTTLVNFIDWVGSR